MIILYNIYGLDHSGVLPRSSITAIINYCRKFPIALIRPLSCGKSVGPIWGLGYPCSFKLHMVYLWMGIHPSFTFSINLLPMIPAMINHMSHDLYMAWIYLNSSISPSCRPWKYNPDIEEYFVEDESTVKLKRSDMTKQIETTELDDGSLVFFSKNEMPQRWTTIYGCQTNCCLIYL